ncbi:MAG: cytochrome c3 family protein [Desulfosudaceae bacterium]
MALAVDNGFYLEKGWCAYEKSGFLVVAAALVLSRRYAGCGKKHGAGQNLVIPGGSKADITLPHARHQEVLDDCDSCHNLFPQQAGSIVQMKEAGELKKVQVMKQCQGCHRDLGKAGKKAGPVGCRGCHIE